MKISAIQRGNIPPKTEYKKICKPQKPDYKESPAEPMTFKGKGAGALLGLGAGMFASFGTLAAATMEGLFTLPALLGALFVAGTTFLFGAAGDKIEDMVNKK